MQTIVVTGGTGLVGRVVIKKLLQKGYKVIVFTRDKAKDKKTERGRLYSYWNINAGELDEKILSGADAVIHLAGAGVADKRWSVKRKQEILSSRTESGLLISEYLLQNSHQVKAFISASAIGWYGADPQVPDPAPFKEEQPPAGDFLGAVCYEWERSTQPLLKAGVRTVYLRTGIVLSNEGGALAEFKKPLKMKLAAVLGHGKQMVSWIHIDDLANLYMTALENEAFTGAYNAVAPQPVSNEAFMLTLAREMYGKSFMKIHIPSWALKLVLGEMSTEVLKSATVSARKVMDMGFQFRFAEIEPALQDLIKGNRYG
ncbi:TIGR01777 family protein [Niabella ginsenosidivorans]|uniref:TIGR01777 family protein n=1 Tax=Niabella ginsenosidivorans TaxID=1176587 RepID=A0A1A9I466_9BACT|nr:TIGR01777 family oxidoreductase [Niabella ginsenosidivorans]ANH82343.1 TIGR01777 family protein [Niabella ginsenosidivorans]